MAPFKNLGKLLRRFKNRYEDDAIDRLNYYYSSGFIAFMAVLITAKQYCGEPLQCWAPAFFTHAMEQYAEDYCWVRNTWFVRIRDPIPEEHQEREAKELTYYQWAPFILYVVALISYAPSLLWRSYISASAFDLKRIMDYARQSRISGIGHERRQLLKACEYFLEGGLEPYYRMERPRVTSLFTSRLAVFYLLQKLRTHTQRRVFILCEFMGLDDPFFGWTLSRKLTAGRNWDQTGIFPRVTLCDFEVKVMANVHRYTIQCVLVINMFNEKIFLILWFWYVLLFFLTFASFFYWGSTMIFGRHRKFVRTHLERRKVLPLLDNDTLADIFVDHYLRSDGLFLLRLIEHRCGNIVSGELLDALLNSFVDRIKLRKEKSVVTDARASVSPPSTPNHLTVDWMETHSVSSIERAGSPVSPKGVHFNV